MEIHPNRVRQLNEKETGSGPVVYWMQRDQRVHENWAFLYALQQANEREVPLVVVFNLVEQFGDASFRHYDFMFKGLQEVQENLKQLEIPFVLLQGEPKDTLPNFVSKHEIGEVVCDFNPLRFTRTWREQVARAIPIRFSEVDARNVVPCWIASDKEEFAAHTFRPKLHKKVSEYLVNFPPIRSPKQKSTINSTDVDWDALLGSFSSQSDTKPVDWITPGNAAAKRKTKSFIENDLDTYKEKRNDPTESALSNLSPYLHFGQISSQWVALQVKEATDHDKSSRDTFLEELLVRRELTDNYCFYNEDYDKVEGAHAWAQKTIAKHDDDEREHLYERKELEAANTHDELWNAMQVQMVSEGKMHGWCRMYWAKKIKEWSPNTQTAIDRALYLNDKYELDGSDPNGVVGVMWSICGVHDRAWTERPVFGKIRYMNFNGAKRKFDVQAYIDAYPTEKSLFDA